MRANAKEWGIDPNRIGVLGFSAGGHLAAALCASPQRTYAAIDDADKLSCRPDFSVLVYPGYLTVKEEGDKVAADVNVTTNTPPTFLVMSQDDGVRVENVLHYFLALKQAKVPSELHVYPTAATATVCDAAITSSHVARPGSGLDAGRGLLERK
jgi:acetyl esterase/lipase